MRGRSLLSLRDLPPEDWEALLASAERLAHRAIQPLFARNGALAGRRFGALFFNPSLRTRTSFEVACFDLGAHAVHLQPGEGLWKLEHRPGVVMDGDRAEHVTEAIGVLSQMLDGIGVRCFASLRDAAEDRAEPVLSAVAGAATVPVLNLESATDHPHQGLADALALRRRFGGEKVKVVVRWAPHVKPLPRAVPNAALVAFAREGHEVVLCHPEGYELDAEVMAAARGFGEVAVTHDRADQRGARVIYAKSWGSPRLYGDEGASARDLAARRDWMVTPADLGGAVFMHCLPVRRNVVVADAVLDSPASIVLEQAACRLDVQRATLCWSQGVTP